MCSTAVFIVHVLTMYRLTGTLSFTYFLLLFVFCLYWRSHIFLFCPSDMCLCLHLISTGHQSHNYMWSVHEVMVLWFLSPFLCVSWVFVLCFVVFPSCVPELLLSLIFPPHLPCISFISPVLFPVLFSAQQLLPALLLPPLICVSPPLSTCTSSSCYFTLDLSPVISSVFVKLSCSCCCCYFE